MQKILYLTMLAAWACASSGLAQPPVPRPSLQSPMTDTAPAPRPAAVERPDHAVLSDEQQQQLLRACHAAGRMAEGRTVEGCDQQGR